MCVRCFWQWIIEIEFLLRSIVTFDLILQQKLLLGRKIHFSKTPLTGAHLCDPQKNSSAIAKPSHSQKKNLFTVRFLQHTKNKIPKPIHQKKKQFSPPVQHRFFEQPLYKNKIQHGSLEDVMGISEEEKMGKRRIKIV